MSKPFALEPVAQVARDAVDGATRRLGEATTRLAEADRKLAMLIEYREEYQARFRDAVAAGMDSAGWRNFHAFMDKLEAAIETGRRQVALAQEAAAQAQAQWQEAQRRLKAYDVLAERHERSEAKREARVEQRRTDEQAMITHRTFSVPTPRR